MKKLLQPILMPFWWQDLLLTIPRIVYGFLLTADFGSAKFGLPWSPADNNLGFFEVSFWFPNDVAEYGGIFAMFPAFFAWMGAFSEAIGGIFWILGLKTRLFSFLILCTMFVAAFLQQADNGTWNMLPSLGFMWVALFYMILGSGRFGLDFLISNKLEKISTQTFRKVQIGLVGVLLIFLIPAGCVQKTYKQTVKVSLDVSGIKDIKTVGIRGEGKPLSWRKDFEMKPVVKDSLYTATITSETGYKFVELKFVINDEFELQDKSNRRIFFDESKTTDYEAKFNSEK